MKIYSVEDLDVFKKAYELTLKLYKLTEHFLKNEFWSYFTNKKSFIIKH